MSLFIAYLISVLYVGLRATQQLNVVHDRYKLVLPTSLLMAVADYYIINAVVSQSPWVILSFGLGGATGCCISMQVNKFIKRRKDALPSQSVCDRGSAQTGEVP
ncbi:MAG: hypothetical protein RBS78_00935 [Coriobacteriia bacterium]|jgi:hypothetical protein|nr:hypothetical protein [Coriobacteriia bacterium]